MSAVADGDQQRQPDQRAAQVAPEHRRADQRHHDQRAAHGRRALLRRVRRRPVVADELAELRSRARRMNQGATTKVIEQRGQRRQADARRDVAEDVGAPASVRAAIETGETAWSSPRSWARGSGASTVRSASTARSRRMPREALTRIQSPGAVQEATSAAASSGEGATSARAAGSPAARAPSTRAAAKSPTAARPARRPAASRPSARCSASPSGPSSSMSPRIAKARAEDPPAAPPPPWRWRSRRAPPASTRGWRCSSRRGWCGRPPAARRTGGAAGPPSAAPRRRRPPGRRPRAPPPAPPRRSGRCARRRAAAGPRPAFRAPRSGRPSPPRPPGRNSSTRTSPVLRARRSVIRRSGGTDLRLRGDERVAGRQHGHPVLPEPREELPLGARHLLDRVRASRGARPRRW